jgi:hypothetical protein
VATFGDGLNLCVRYTIAFVRKAWWLALMPVTPALLYDFAQVHGIMAWHDYVKFVPYMQFFSTVLSVSATYWVIRFLVLDQSVSAALSVNRQSLSTFAPYAAVFSILWFVVSLLMDAGLSAGAMALVWLIVLCFEVLFAPWSVAAPSGSRSIGPVVSLRHGRKTLVWGVALLLVVRTPFDIASQLLVGLDVAQEGNVGMQSATLASIALVESIGLVAWCAAVFVIASRAGVRVNTSRGIEDVFA